MSNDATPWQRVRRVAATRSARWATAAFAAGAFAAGLTLWTRGSTDFFIAAETAVFSFEVACGQKVVWDLPRGLARAVNGSAAPAAGDVTVVLRGGARARLHAGDDGRLRAEFSSANSFACAEADATPTDVVEVSVGQRLLDAAALYAYRSEPVGELPAGTKSRKLLLRDRVVIGEEVQFGSGSRTGAEAPILHGGRIEVRTKDAATDQRRLMAEERIEAGGIIDSHGFSPSAVDCRHRDTNAAADCRALARWSGEGFAQWPAAASDEGARSMLVQYFVQGPHVGVRWLGGVERKILVTGWAWIITQTWAQALALMFVVIPAFIQTHAALRGEAVEPADVASPTPKGAPRADPDNDRGANA